MHTEQFGILASRYFDYTVGLWTEKSIRELQNVSQESHIYFKMSKHCKYLDMLIFLKTDFASATLKPLNYI